MRRALLAALVAGLLAASPVAATTGIGWRQAPVGLDVYSNAEGAVADVQAVALADWNASPYVELDLRGTNPGTFRYDGMTWPCGLKRGAIVVCVTDNNAAFAYIKLSGGFFKSVFVALPIQSTGYALACQEIGHALGLNHSTNDPDSCMNGPVPATHPSAQDYADLAAMYGP